MDLRDDGTRALLGERKCTKAPLAAVSSLLHPISKDTATPKALEKGNRRIYRAWRLKDEFEQLWEYKTRRAVGPFLKRWTTTA